MREADDSLCKFLQSDIEEICKELERLEKDLARIEESKVGNAYMIQMSVENSKTCDKKSEFSAFYIT